MDAACERESAAVRLAGAIRRRRGFTLIEMMVVIAIIVILIGLILPTIGAVRERAKIKATQTLIQGIDAALRRYYMDMDEYPPSTVADLGDPDPKPDSLYLYLCGTDGKGIKKKTGDVTRKYEAYMVPPPENIRKIGAEIHIVDSWGNDIVYLNCKRYTDQMRGPDPNYVDDGKCRNPNSFDLYSVGPDRQKDPDPLNLVDDICNWK